MRILSGIQPSGRLHVGNYFGMMKPAIQLQEQGEAFYFIADYHALTTVGDGGQLREYVQEVALDFLACGLDPERTVFFRQSDVPEVAELAWILSTLTPMGLLERCHSYKDKTSRGLAATHGLFAYPVLMAADILLYDSDAVPVGRDQKQHLEVTRDLAIKLNEQYGDGLVKLPEPVIQKESAVVPGLDGQKMSKSYDNTIPLFSEPSTLKKLIMRRIPTDSTLVEDPKPTENSTILQLFRLFASGPEYRRMEDEFRSGGVGYGDFKKRLLNACVDYFEPMRQRRAELAADPGAVEEILRKGAARARAEAARVLGRVRRAVGLGSL